MRRRARRARAREIDPVEHLALVVELAIGRVDVLRSTPLPHRPGPEPAHAPARIRGREHDLPAEEVIDLPRPRARALDEAGPEELLLAEAAAARGEQHPVPGARRVADAELAQRLLGEAASGEVLARTLRLLGVPQVARVERRGASEQRVQALTAGAISGRRGVLLLGLQPHPEAVGKRLDRALEVEPLRLHDEVERVAGLRTAEAVVVLLVGADVKRGGALLVERAAAEIAVDSGPPQLDLRLDEGDHVDRVTDAVARVGCVAAHGANAVGTLSASNCAIAKRSVMPAM